VYTTASAESVTLLARTVDAVAQLLENCIN
jgi:hypothetical protein